jgi:hypothetical protein
VQGRVQAGAYELAVCWCVFHGGWRRLLRLWCV